MNIGKGSTDITNDYLLPSANYKYIINLKRVYLCIYVDISYHIFILSFRSGCVIPDGDSMVLTGGFERWKHVTRYPGNADLPQLNDERSNHGCSSFLLDDGNKVCKKCKYKGLAFHLFRSTLLPEVRILAKNFWKPQKCLLPFGYLLDPSHLESMG